VWFHSFLISSLGGGENSASRPWLLYPQRRYPCQATGRAPELRKRCKSHSLARNWTMIACRPDCSAVIQPNTLHHLPVISQTQTINTLLSYFFKTHHHISPIYTYTSSKCLVAKILCASLSLDTCAKCRAQYILLHPINIPTGHKTQSSPWRSSIHVPITSSSHLDPKILLSTLNFCPSFNVRQTFTLTQNNSKIMWIFRQQNTNHLHKGKGTGKCKGKGHPRTGHEGPEGSRGTALLFL
jgi:hypothetical protein